jgi:exonuclease 3'-5' domain-containing protein 1
MATEDNELVERLSKLKVNPDKKSEPIKPIEFTLCDSETSLLSAISFLETCPSIVIDCEGLNLGVHGGSLSLVCIRSMVPQKEEIFLFDIVALTCSLKPLFDILANTNIVKVLYDGRKDFCALYHYYGVVMANVIDIQLADVKSRFIHQETPQRHIQRLGRCFLYKQLHDPRHAYKYENVHVLQGLGSCLVDHQCTTTSPKGHGIRIFH